MKDKLQLYNAAQKDSNNFVRWLGRLLAERDISALELAKSCNISYRTVNRWLNEAHIPDAESIKKLTNSEYVDMNFEDLSRMARGDKASLDEIASAEEALEHIAHLSSRDKEEIAHRIVGELPSPNIAGLIGRAAFILSERDYRFRP